MDKGKEKETEGPLSHHPKKAISMHVTERDLANVGYVFAPCLSSSCTDLFESVVPSPGFVL